MGNRYAFSAKVASCRSLDAPQSPQRVARYPILYRTFDVARRNEIKVHHTSAHLLQAALINVVGDEVKQAGSQVEENRMRFDFTFSRAMTPQEIEKTENLMNKWIGEKLPIQTDVMNIEEDILIAALTKVKEKYGNEIKNEYNMEVIVPTKPFPRIKLQDLYKELNSRYGYEIPTTDVGDMNSEAEKLAARYAMEVYGHEFIFITDFAKTKRAFYHMRENEVPQGYDLIWRGTEITTGAQREHRYDVLCRQAEEKGLGEDVKFYLEFFKYGCPPHGGFGLGVDRLTMLLLGTSTLKETMFLFRGPNRLTP